MWEAVSDGRLSLPRGHVLPGFLGPKRLRDDVGLRVPDGLKPAPATHLVEPPLAVIAAFVLARVNKMGPLLRGGRVRIGALLHFAAETVLAHVTQAAIGTGNLKRHGAN